MIVSAMTKKESFMMNLGKTDLKQASMPIRPDSISNGVHIDRKLRRILGNIQVMKISSGICSAMGTMVPAQPPPTGEGMLNMI